MPSDFSPEILLDMTVRGKLRNFNGTGLNKDKQAVVYYDVPLGAGTECVEWLQNNRKTVRDVEIDHQRLDGVWRSASVQSEQSTSNKQSVTIVQTLKYGWIESLVSGSTVDWSEARYERGNEWQPQSEFGVYPETASEVNNPQQYHLIRWEGIDPTKVDEIRSSLRDLPVSAWSPVVNGETIGTGFFLLDAVATKEEQNDLDRSYRITALIAKPRFNLQAWEAYGTPGESKIYYLFDVPTVIAQSLINIYNTRVGSTVSASAPDERGLVNLTVRDKPDESSEDEAISATSCAFYTLTTFYSGMDAPVAVPDNEMGITYRSRFDFIRQEGTYSGTIEKRVRQSQKVEYRGTNTHGEYVDVFDYTGLYLVDGVLYYRTLKTGLAGDIETDVNTVVTLPSNVIAKGETWEVQKRTNEDCTLDVTVRERTEKEITDLQYRSAQSAAAESTTTEKYNQEAVPVVEASPGKVVRVGVRYNKQTGLLDAEEVETEVVNQTGANTSDNTFESLAEAVNTQADNALAAAVSSDGVIRENQSRPTEAGKHNTSARIRTAKTVTDAQKVNTENTFESSERDTIRNKNGAARVSSSADGVIESVTVEKSEFPDRIHDTKEVRTAKEVLEAQKAETETKFESQHSDTTRNAATARTVTLEAGKIKTQRVEKSEFPDRVHDTLEERTAKAVSDAQKTTQVDAFSKVASSTDRNQNTPAPAETVQTPGFIKKATAQVNDFDKYDNTVEEREAITQENTGGTVTATTYETQEGSSARNLVDEPMPDATESGKIKSFRKSLNDMLRWDKDGTERTAITVADAQKTESANTFESTARDTIRNKAGVARVAASADGVIETVSVEKSEFPDRIHDTKEARTAVTVTDAQTEETKSLFEDTVSDTIRNKSGVAREASVVEGEIQTVRVEKSEFPDRIHDTLSRRIFKAVLGFLKGYSDTKAVQTETTGDRNAVEPLELVAVDTAAGKITEVQSEKNQSGRWDRRKVERTAKNQTSTDTQDGHLSTTEIVKNTQAAAAAERVASAGERVSVQNQETEYGKHSTAVLVETAIELTTTDRDRGHVSDTDTVKKWNADKVTEVPVVTAGEVKALVQTPTPYKDKWNVVESTELSKPWDSGWIEYNTKGGTIRIRVWGNQDASFADSVAAAWADETESNTSLRVSYNKFGKWDGSATEAIPDSDEGAGTFWYSIRTKSTAMSPLTRKDETVSPGAGYSYIEYKRPRTLVYWSAIRQQRTQAQNDKETMVEGLGENKEFVERPSIVQVGDEKGRRGFLVSCYYIEYGDWVIA